ncbi:unnamed protein product [Symbiodinium pilosum]|uniref:Uncharacterized protein n=1 Tax=Symbiodinium pilosum TaxID=2952 RepID=A0A812JL69_SYMPI|nr:unnamed protein product [Symbiodinium pilosum]
MVVAELLEHGAPLPLILLCLLAGFNPRLSHTQDYDYLEVFAGAGQVSEKLRQDGLTGAGLEILSNPMLFDLTSDVGYALAVNAVLRLRPRGFMVVALCCDSFTIM